jgi:GTP-binding protein HflX
VQAFVTDIHERALLIGVVSGPALSSNGRTSRAAVEEYLGELGLLAESAGATVVRQMVQQRNRIDAAYFVGKGKAEEVASLVESEGIDLIIFDDDLSPTQVRNLERLVNRKILDRSGLILAIFASRAKTSEAKTQVELAQLQYMLPRLTRQWTHLSKQYGGIGTKGPGETQIETDRRVIRAKISHLKGKLREIGKERAVQRKGREHYPRITLVGYTNAGKSTLLNWFADAHVPVEDRLFATLDSTVRLVALTPTHKILLGDTVGFIRKLPHTLVASFKSTLEEVTEADILLHVVDASHPHVEEQITVVNETLEEIGANGKPTLIVFNKIDRITNRSLIGYLHANHETCVFVSATRGLNMGALTKKLAELLDANITEQTVTLGQKDYSILWEIHNMAEIVEKRYDDDAITVRIRINKVNADRLQKALARRQHS